MKKQPPIPVELLLKAPELQTLGLKIVAGGRYLAERVISNPRIQKPGLALAGYLPYIKGGRLQILGKSEYEYLKTLTAAESDSRWRAVIDREVPAIVSAKGLMPPEEILRYCEERNVPFLVTTRQTSEAISLISMVLEEHLAPQLQVHGVLLDVFSLGTLIVGDAGIGKSECALELVYRGHRLVADDVVVLRRTHGAGLLGTAHSQLEHFLELRGVGIIDVRKHFGMTATSPVVNVSLMIRLVKLSEETKALERRWRENLMENAQPWTQTQRVLGCTIPLYTMAVAPGRDVAIMVETAVRKCLLAQRGVDDERSFIESVNRRAGGFVIEELPINGDQVP